MTEKDLFDALDGLYAYDTGCTDSGIHDEVLRARTFAHLRAMHPDEFRVTLGRFLRESFLTEQRLAQGYGPEDVESFLRWGYEQHTGTRVGAHPRTPR